MSLLPVVMSERAVALILAVGWALVLFVGQGLLIGLVVAALLRTLRDRSADLRYGVACAGLLVMAVCPVVTTVLGLSAGRGETSPSPRGVTVSVRAIAREGGREVAEVPSVAVPDPLPGGDGVEGIATAVAPEARPVWRDRVEACLPMVVAGWLVGVCMLAMRLVKGLVDVRGLARRGLLGPTDEIHAAFGRLVKRAGLRRPVIAFLSARVEVPTVVGWLRPRVLIPVGSLARLTFQQLEALLARDCPHPAP